MGCSGWRSPGKKTLGYKERDEQQRQAYLRRRDRYQRQGKELVYVDESGFAPVITRRYAYAPKGQRVYGIRSAQRRPRTSLIAARMGQTLQAPLLFEGSCTTALFNAWLAQQLCPRLHDRHVVVMDNAPFHKSALTHALITGTGATLLFLPPYSPDLNPIEHDFAILKRRREYREQDSLDTLIQTYQSLGA
jgi:putative transposase